MTRIVAILPARNEGWILGLSVRALLLWVDTVIVCNHASTDNTAAILDAIAIEYEPHRLQVIEDSDTTWHEMSQRQSLLEAARFLDATHVVTIDADEVVSGNLLPRIRDIVRDCPRNRILQLPWLQLKGGIGKTIVTGMWAMQNASSAFVDDPQWHWQARFGYDHHHRHPMGKPFVQHLCVGRDCGLMHLQMASDNRLRWKQFTYKLIERLRWPNRMTPAQLNTMYDPTVNVNAATAIVPDSWWAPYADLMQYLKVDDEPWQKPYALRIMAENPGIELGLTDFGVLSSSHEEVVP